MPTSFGGEAGGDSGSRPRRWRRPRPGARRRPRASTLRSDDFSKVEAAVAAPCTAASWSPGEGGPGRAPRILVRLPGDRTSSARAPAASRAWADTQNSGRRAYCPFSGVVMCPGFGIVVVMAPGWGGSEADRALSPYPRCHGRSCNVWLGLRLVWRAMSCATVICLRGRRADDRPA